MERNRCDHWPNHRYWNLAEQTSSY